VKREWFGVISRADYLRLEGKRAPVFFLDTAYTEKTDNDPTGIIGTNFINGNIYIFRAQKRYLEFPQLNKYIIEFCRSNGYVTGSSIRIEPKASGLSVIQQIKSDTLLNVIQIPTPKDDKTTRLNLASPAVESGRVYLVVEPWNGEFLSEVCGYPSAKHDEYVDLLSYAVDHWINRRFKPARIKLGRHQSA
jgi:predicted phage terminase large subunit-like protein